MTTSVTLWNTSVVTFPGSCVSHCILGPQDLPCHTKESGLQASTVPHSAPSSYLPYMSPIPRPTEPGLPRRISGLAQAGNTVRLLISRDVLRNSFLELFCFSLSMPKATPYKRGSSSFSSCHVLKRTGLYIWSNQGIGNVQKLNKNKKHHAHSQPRRKMETTQRAVWVPRTFEEREKTRSLSVNSFRERTVLKIHIPKPSRILRNLTNKTQQFWRRRKLEHWNPQNEGLLWDKRPQKRSRWSRRPSADSPNEDPRVTQGRKEGASRKC